MFAHEVHTVGQFMRAVAFAMGEGDRQLLDALRHLAEGWLQPEYELSAQLMLIEAAERAIES
jgi:hypothetical protein